MRRSAARRFSTYVLFVFDRPYLVQPAARPTDSKDAAAATAAFGVLVALFPEQQATLQARYDASLAAFADTPPGAKAAGIAVGEQAAARCSPPALTTAASVPSRP